MELREVNRAMTRALICIHIIFIAITSVIIINGAFVISGLPIVYYAIPNLILLILLYVIIFVVSGLMDAKYKALLAQKSYMISGQDLIAFPDV